MISKEVICVICPHGCRITVTGEGVDVASVEGNMCPRGHEYASSEFINPCRTLTTSVVLNGAGRKMLPIRSNMPVPKSLMLDCMQEVKKVSVTAPIAMHQVIIKDILGTGIDMVACMPIA